MTPKRPSINEVKQKVEEIGDIHLPHWSSLLLWIAGVLLMIGLTVRYVCPICKNYFDDDENVAVKIGVENNFTPSHFPSLYVCVPTVYSRITRDLLERLRNHNTSGCEICRQLQEHSWDVWKDVDFFKTSNIEADFNKLIIDKLFSNLTDFRFEISVGSDNSKQARGHWQLIIYEQMFQFFHSIFYTDDDFFRLDKLVGETYTWKQPWNVQSHRDDRDIDQLFGKVAEFLCNSYSWGPISRKEPNETYSQTIQKCATYLQRTGSMINPVGRVFCTKLPSYPSIDFGGNTHGIGSNESYYDILRDNREFWPMISLQTQTPILRNSVTWLPDFHYSTKENDERFDAVYISYSLQATIYEERQKIKKKCYVEKSQRDCTIRCKAEKVRQHCQCVPFTIRSLIDKGNLTYCNQEKYVACGTKAFDRFAECESECEHACQYDIYQWQVVTSPQSPNRTRVSVELKPFISPYLRFTVTNRDGIEDLISQVGGLFNFYLGWSGLTVIFVLVYAWDCLRRWNNGHSPSAATALRMATKWRVLTASETDRSEMQPWRARFDDMENELKRIKRHLRL